MQLTSQFDETISSWTTPENTLDRASGSSGSSSSSAHTFSSPLGFLQAALPEIPTARLNKALQDSEKDGVEMWDIVAGILTEESIREMEERGLEGLEEDERMSGPIYDESKWETVPGKKKPSDVAKRKSRPRKFALADVRQQHQHVQAHHKKHTHESIQRPQPVADPWTQISSLSDHVSSLLPPHPPSVFQSFFHSPKYTTSYDALRAALTSLCQHSEEDGDHHMVIFNILDLVIPQYEISDDVHRARIVSDVQLAVGVTNGASDEALQLIDLLRELDSNADLGVYHQPAPQAWKKESEGQPMSGERLPSSPPPIQPPPVRAKGVPSAAPTARNKPSPYQWQAVPQRKAVPRGPHPLAHHIPAYVRDVNGMKTARAYGAKGGKAAAADASEFQRRMDETMRKRNEALREASRMWQKGNAKTRGGEVAFYFAERVSVIGLGVVSWRLIGARLYVGKRVSGSREARGA